MTEGPELKPLSTEAVPRAVEKAEHYRLLNDPEQAESICLDVLEVEPAHQRALVTLVLALTDQVAYPGRGTHATKRARRRVEQLDGDYERAYYAGLVCERQARAYLEQGGMSRQFACEALQDALGWYAKAEELRPAGNDDPILRWNACVRTLRDYGLEPRVDEGELPLE